MDYAVDWAVIEAKYINDSTVSMDDLAVQFNVPVSTLKSRAKKGEWTTKRQLRTADVVQKATERATASQAAIAAKFNEDDIKLSRALKAKVAEILGGADEIAPAELSALAGTLDKAQKIGRLALGMTTSKDDMTSSDGSMKPAMPVFTIVGVAPKDAN